MTADRDHTLAFLDAFYGRNTVYDFRAMHDRDRAAPARTWRGTYEQCESEMRAWNTAEHGYGLHIVINAMGDEINPVTGRLALRKSNVTACRAQLLDLDDVDAGQQMGRVLASTTPPHILVHTSAGKVQCWFKVVGHTDKQLHEDNQRRLIGQYNGDDQFIDVAHTARLPGFYHHKAAPSLVTVAAGPMWGGRSYDPWEIAIPLLGVQIEGGSADRQPLGYEPWRAPSREWLEYALSRIDPNGLGRMAWLATTAAMKQAGWFLGPDVVRSIWDQWCARFVSDKPVTLYEYNKQWNSIDATSAGWNALVRRAGIAGDLMAQGLAVSSSAVARTDAVSATPSAATVQPVATGEVLPATGLGTMLRPDEQAVYFAGCYWIAGLGRIFTPDGILMDQNKFNGTYGSKSFVLDDIGKAGKNAWEAATQGQLYHVPKVTHLRFLPNRPYGDILLNEFGSKGVNTYRKPVYAGIPGDVTPFMDHLVRVLPVQSDRDILLAFMAQCVQRPGVKVKWSVVVQSGEGIGKTLFQYIMQAALGMSYVHTPAAKELTDGGGKFNGWMRNKLMIIINEVKSDEKRELVEVMKPWITDERIEMQNKGQDQDMADNPTNWLMFTNHKDAIPVTANGRRYAIMYSALQTKEDKAKLGMNGRYMSNLYKWAKAGGVSHVVDFLMHYPIPVEYDAEIECVDAPNTSSMAEAVEISRGWLEQLILDAVNGNRQGFRNGWISSGMVMKMLSEQHMKSTSPRAVSAAIQSLGYRKIGQSTRLYPSEMLSYQATLYSNVENATAADYGHAQGYDLQAVSSVVPMWPNPVPHAAE